MYLELITQEPGNNLNVLQEAYAGLQVEMKRKENKTQLQLNSSTLVTTSFKCAVFRQGFTLLNEETAESSSNCEEHIMKMRQWFLVNTLQMTI